jgi:hypothetical protein
MRSFFSGFDVVHCQFISKSLGSMGGLDGIFLCERHGGGMAGKGNAREERARIDSKLFLLGPRVCVHV